MFAALLIVNGNKNRSFGMLSSIIVQVLRASLLCVALSQLYW
jgi:hypothetical protein